MTAPLGFTDVVGQTDAKLALLLGAVDPLLGGVLLRGEKGSAKTTLARGLAGLLGGAPFVELPLSATEDRVVGSIDVAAAITGGELRVRPGLLADVEGGVLYVDEINLLPDHLVDVLLDVAASGVNRIERDGVSHQHPARFVLVGSMNPEEGELRPQLLDRFGLCVDVAAPRAIDERVEAIRRRLHHDGARVDQDPSAPPTDRRVDELARTLSSARPARLPLAVLDAASRVAVEVGAEGLRADLALCRAAAAAAGLDGRDEATLDDLRRVAPMVLAHRGRRRPFDPPGMPPDALADALARTLGERDADAGTGTDPAGGAGPYADGDDDRGGGAGADDAFADRDDHRNGADGTGDRTDRDRRDRDGGAPGPDRSGDLALGPSLRPPLPPPSLRVADRGRAIGSVPAGAAPSGSTIAIIPTARHLAARRSSGAPVAGGGPATIEAASTGATAGPEGSTTPVHPDDLRAAVRAAPARRLIVLCVDLSGSMGADERARAASGTAIGLLDHAYQRRHRVAVIGFRGEGAEVLLTPTSSVEVARNRLRDLRTGGRTPLAHGLRSALEVAAGRNAATGAGDDEPLLVVLTDGRATGDGDPLGDALHAAAEVRRRGVAAVVVDCEPPHRPLGLARRLAEALGGAHVAAAALTPSEITDAVRSVVAR